jgi:hypothetical protein
MTAVAPSAGRERPGPMQTGSVPWRRLTWAAWRQHRAGLMIFAILIGLTAIAMALTGLALHPAGSRVFSAAPHSLWPLYDVTDTSLRMVLPLIPVLAGLFLGAPLVAREIETGTARFAWAQGAGRTRWLIATVVPIAMLLAAVAIGLGLEFRWWANPLEGPGWAWRPDLFGLNPLPFTGWMLLGFSLAVFFGAAVRRTVAAMAATLAGYLPLMYLVATTWRRSYVAPLHLAGAQPEFNVGGGYGYSMYLARQHGPGPDILSTALGWPDGRLLTNSQLDHSAAWFRQHHIQIWLTYQPGGRFFLFECIEFGWLVVLSAILIGVTIVMIRRRAA